MRCVVRWRGTMFCTILFGVFCLVWFFEEKWMRNSFGLEIIIIKKHKSFPQERKKEKGKRKKNEKKILFFILSWNIFFFN